MRHNSNSHGSLNDVTCHVMVQYISNGCNAAGSTSLITKLFFLYNQGMSRYLLKLVLQVDYKNFNVCNLNYSYPHSYGHIQCYT